MTLKEAIGTLISFASEQREVPLEVINAISVIQSQAEYGALDENPMDVRQLNAAIKQIREDICEMSVEQQDNYNSLSDRIAELETAPKNDE